MKSIFDYKKKYEEAEFNNKRNYLKFQIINQWMRLRTRGVGLGEFFSDRKIKTISIYGLGELGELIYEEMTKQADVNVLFAIDRNRIEADNLMVFSLDDIPNAPDAVVISPVLNIDEIEDKIYEKLGEIPTYTLEEIIYELSRKHGVSSLLWEI